MRAATVWMGLFSGVIAIGCGGAPSAVRAPMGREPVETTTAFLGFDYLHDVYGVDPLTDVQAAGRWHWQLDSVDGVIVGARQISPTGAEHARRTFARSADKTFSATVFSAYGVRDAVVTIDASGLEHRVALSGFVGSGGCYQRRVTEDAQGRRVEERCLDPVGRATPDTNGCERRRLDRDARNHVVATKCLHDDGTPATYANEHYEARVTVDELGQETAYDYLDVDGHPKPTGCARMVRDFLPNGLIHAQRCTDGSGAFDTAMRFSYDENGCRSEVWNVDAQGQPIERNGSAGALWTLNEKCSAVVHRTVDARGNPTGMHPIQRYQLDAQGYATRMECFVRDGVATPCRGLPTYQYVASVQRFSYDEHRRVTLTECFDPLGHPAPCGDHRPAVEAYEYGADGQLRVERSLDARRQPALGHGVSYDEIARDFAGRVASRKSFGLLGEPVVSDLGCHEIRWVRDDHHRLVEVECFGINERPSASSMCIDEVCWPVGTARVQVVRISESKRENVFYDVDGKELRRDSCDKSRCYW